MDDKPIDFSRSFDEMSDEEQKLKFEESCRYLREPRNYFKCPYCAHEFLIPSVGRFDCQSCKTKFRTGPSHFGTIGHWGGEIDPESINNRMGIGPHSQLYWRDEDKLCITCGFGYPIHLSICPNLIKFALSYYCVPERDRFPETRARIIALLLKHAAVAIECITELQKSEPEKWKAICASGLPDVMQQHWGTF